MNIRHRFFIRVTIAMLCMAACPASAQDTPELKPLSELLPGNYHRSTYYRINDVFPNKRNYVFFVESEYGNFRIESVGLTLKYLREIQIVSQVLHQIQATADTSAVDLQSQLRISADSAIDILSSPLDTAGNLAGQLARNLGDTFAGNSPYITHDRKLSGASEQDPNLRIHKRNISSQLGLDVYSSNSVVQRMLLQLARERSAGNISSGSVLVNVNNNYEKKAGRLDFEIASILRKHTVDQLYLHNSGLLDRTGISKEISNQFLMHPAYSPSLQTRIIKYLDHLYGVENREDFLELSLLATDEVTANAFARILHMIVTYEEENGKAKQIKLIGLNVSIVTDSNKQVLIYPDDMFNLDINHSELISNVAERARINKYKNVSVQAYGSISDQAKAELLAKDMDFRERVLFD
ncbi:MAG: hypothetical protein MI673_04910 [Thiotrichales bacterium]|nr:hypothetical protein [Thiotrichales bacterium]